MYQRILLTAVLVFLFSGVWAQNAQRTFEEMGYKDQSIVGISGAITYFVKVNPEDDIAQSKLVLYLRPSQVLNPNTSTITVSVKDASLYTKNNWC